MLICGRSAGLDGHDDYQVSSGVEQNELEFGSGQERRDVSRRQGNL